MRADRVRLTLNGTVVADERVTALDSKALRMGAYFPVYRGGQLKPGRYQYKVWVEGRNRSGDLQQTQRSGSWTLDAAKNPLVLELEPVDGQQIALSERSS
ncbi:hypothetical protein GP5015_1408 [gamma proteobacterium HTCC5015]|nr:hypothetical protein GP5015_1408 [gamma proteobacterium HTCC5015]